VDISHQEKEGRLANRIRAHKLFANFDITSWISNFVGSRQWDSVLDVGCGDGNHLGIYLRNLTQSGTVVGIDRDVALLARAKSQYADAANLDLRVCSMDERLPFADGVFDLVMSVFAIYNAKDPEATLSEIHRTMRPGAHLVLVGSTINNARELYDFNERLTGLRMDERMTRRVNRLADEFLPIVQKLFEGCRDERLDSHLTFPDQDEFLRYYRSTLLYEDTAEKMGISAAEMKASCPSTLPLRLSKEMLVITARKAH
jgi:ubiquinone/menaquinone biosynthesis C-methylase UbiE